MTKIIIVDFFYHDCRNSKNNHPMVMDIQLEIAIEDSKLQFFSKNQRTVETRCGELRIGNNAEI